MVFMRPTLDVPNCASGMLGVAVDGARHAGRPQQLLAQVAVDELVDVAQVLQQFPALPNGGVTSSISDSEKSVVMCSLVSGAPSAAGCGVCDDLAAGDTRSDSFSTPLRPPSQHGPFARIDEPGQPALEFPVDHVTQHLNLKNANQRQSDRILELADCRAHPQWQLGDDLDFHQETRVHQPLHLHPGGRRQPLLVVVLETQIRRPSAARPCPW